MAGVVNYNFFFVAVGRISNAFLVFKNCTERRLRAWGFASLGFFLTPFSQPEELYYAYNP